MSFPSVYMTESANRIQRFAIQLRTGRPPGRSKVFCESASSKKSNRQANQLAESWPKVARKWPRDINKEMFAKRVAVRAVELSIGAFCTEFRCEQLCDDDMFLDRARLFAFFCNSTRFSEPRTKKNFSATGVMK